jgi:lysophospholipase L1-like esterase
VAGVACPNDSALARGLMTEGTNARLERFFDKVRSRKSVRVAFLGGSITQGHFASHQDLRYSTLLVRFLQKGFPNLDTVIEINAGITATGSRYGASRAASDVLAHDPDLVVVEHSVNDFGTGPGERIQATFEGVLRQCLKHDPDVPVIALFTSKPDGLNTQELHAPVAAHYGVPMVSYRDAVWPYVEAGRMTAEDLFYDAYAHPNDAGMMLAGHLLYAYLKKVAAQSGGPGTSVPAPLVSDLYEWAGILSEGDSAVKFEMNGWQRLPLEKGRYAFTTQTAAPSTLILRTRRREITLGIHMQPQDTSSVRVIVPGVIDTVLSNQFVFFDYTRHVHLFSVDNSALRTIEIRHTGAKFTIDHILYAGPEE